MSDFNVSAEHQHVLCQMTDWNGAFTKDSPLFAPDQSIGHKDRTVVLQVLTAGPGNISRGTLNPCTLSQGDLIVVNFFHKSHELLLQGNSVLTINWEHVMAKLNINDETKTVDLLPLQAYVVCQRNEAKAQKIMMGDSLILAPGVDSQVVGGGNVDERGKPKEQIKIAVEQVVSCGPGAVIDGLFQAPSYEPGDMVMYDTSVAPVQFRLAGSAYTLVHYRHVIMSFRDEAAKVS